MNHGIILEMGKQQRDMAPYQFAAQVPEEPFRRLAAIEDHAAFIDHQRGNIVLKLRHIRRGL